MVDQQRVDARRRAPTAPRRSPWKRPFASSSRRDVERAEHGDRRPRPERMRADHLDERRQQRRPRARSSACRSGRASGAAPARATRRRAGPTQISATDPGLRRRAAPRRRARRAARRRARRSRRDPVAVAQRVGIVGEPLRDRVPSSSSTPSRKRLIAHVIGREAAADHDVVPWSASSRRRRRAPARRSRFATRAVDADGRDARRRRAGTAAG